MKTPLNAKYILPSPAGAFYSISHQQAEPAKQFLQNLMTANHAASLDATSIGDNEQLLQHVQKLKWLQS